MYSMLVSSQCCVLLFVLPGLPLFDLYFSSVFSSKISPGCVFEEQEGRDCVVV